VSVRASSQARLLAPASVVILAGVVAALHLTKLIPALPVLQRELAMTLVQAGFLLSAAQLAGMTLGALIGLAADGLGLRRSLLAGLLTLALASTIGGWASDAPSMLVLRVIEGLGFLLTVTPAPGLIRRLVAGQGIGRLLGIWSAYMPVATAMALLGGPFVIAFFGWQVLWWWLAGATLLLALWVWRVVPADPADPAAAGPATPAGQNATWERLKLALTRRGPWLVALCFAVYSLQWLAVIGFLPTMYAQAGVALGASAALTALAAGVNMVGNIVSGRLLSAGARPERLLYTGYAVMALAACVAYADLPGWVALPGSGGHFATQYLAVLVFSMVGGVIPGTLFSLAVRLAPSESTVSTTIGWMQQWSAIGQFVGPPVVALVASRMGGWQWTWVVTASFAGLGLLLARQVARLLARSLES
jgi:MFS transporter, CP family, cyanate transporter